jgi:nicotinamidase-related amidase
MSTADAALRAIEAQRCALLVIDAQREYFDHDGALYTPNAAAIVEPLQRLLGAARRHGIAVIYLRHVFAADGSDVGRMGDYDDTPSFVEGTRHIEIVDELAPLPGEPVIDKTRYSAFVNTRLESVLKTAGIDTVIVTGLMTQHCSVTTARHAHDLDYRVVFVPDANAGPDLPDTGFGPVTHEEALRVIATSLAGGVATVLSVDEVIAACDGLALDRRSNS